MRKIKSLALLTAVMGILSIASCTKDPCADVSCGNGTCDDGTCLCETGYEGSSCNTEMRQKFYGAYYGTMTIANQTQTAAIQVYSYNGNILRIWVDGDFYLEISGSSSVTIPTQIINVDNDTYGIQGTGSLINNTIQLSMTWTTQGVNIPVVFNGTK